MIDWERPNSRIMIMAVQDNSSNNSNHKSASLPSIWMPPGFRFHPTDYELITFYLVKKVSNSRFEAHAIAEVDLNKYEPWELPERANMGEKEWYFFSLRDRKYPTGMRTNRATEAGYWKATGKDRDVRSPSNPDKNSSSSLVGMKKTLVFYKGRAPRGEKTNWVMHEYRLDGKTAHLYGPRATKEEWVVCRIFQKRAVLGKKAAFDDSHDSDVGMPSSPSPADYNASCRLQQRDDLHEYAGVSDYNSKSSLLSSRNSFWDTCTLPYSGLPELAKLLEPELLPALKGSPNLNFKLKSCKSEPYVVDASGFKLEPSRLLGECSSFDQQQQQEAQQQQQEAQQQQQQQQPLFFQQDQQGLNELIFNRFLSEPTSLELDQLSYAF